MQISGACVDYLINGFAYDKNVQFHPNNNTQKKKSLVELKVQISWVKKIERKHNRVL